MDPLVSVIIPAFNCERYIGETLQSVINQIYQNLEIIVVDDGSTDDQNAVIRRFAEMDDRVKLYSQSNQGVSAARNNGYKKSTGEFVAFLDADDVWLPENVGLKVARFFDDDVGLVHSDVAVINEMSELTGGVLQGAEGEVLDDLLSWEGTQIPGPSSVLTRRQVLDAVGLFDEGLSTSADKDLFIRIAAEFRVGRVPAVTLRYRIHPSNMHKNITAMETDVLRLYEKARRSKLFKSKAFEQKCFSNMYLILAASWAGDGRSIHRALIFFYRAIRNDPAVTTVIIKKMINRYLPRRRAVASA